MPPLLIPTAGDHDIVMELEEEDGSSSFTTSPSCKSSSLSATASSTPEPSSKTTEKLKKVRFAPNVKNYKFTIHIRDYTIVEKELTWYDWDDLKLFKMDRRLTAKRINEGKAGKMETRGCEGSSKEGGKLRVESILKARKAVMEEQRAQEEQRIPYDFERFARVCITHSLPSQMLANERGMGDQLAVSGPSSSSNNAIDDYIEDTCRFLTASTIEARDDVTSGQVPWQRL